FPPAGPPQPSPRRRRRLHQRRRRRQPLAPTHEDSVLSRASHLARPEVLRRRSRRLKQLSRCYRDHYWALMEELKVQYRDYYWKYGMSPFKEESQRMEVDGSAEPDGPNGEGIGENVGSSVVLSRSEFEAKGNNKGCSFQGCKLKAMALTSFCHLHILSDPRQKLYKACSYVIKSAPAGSITCGKPIMRSTVPSLCSVHFQKAQKHVTRALKKAGLNVTSSSKLAPKFHVIVAEYVRQIQAKRRAAQRAKTSEAVVVKEETMN
ncbi:INO80 complex subunit D, partial [Eucalyptus grandis]|uniref:INO80 complex subunit D n=1 Tax=Eucalyptus grandis TaxID=71139 RepID=UPI00192EBA31